MGRTASLTTTNLLDRFGPVDQAVDECDPDALARTSVEAPADVASTP
jgi:hypothetical protein